MLHFRKNTNSQHVIRFFCNEHGYRGFTICITFFRESRERERKIPLFSLTHPFLEIFFLKVTFPGKKIRHFCSDYLKIEFTLLVEENQVPVDFRNNINQNKIR